MPIPVKRVSIFLSSPSDLTLERATVLAVCNEINLDQGRHANFYIDVISWETHVRPGISNSGQSVINYQVGNNYDIYLGVLGARFGSSTLHWGSGTEEEFQVALTRFQNSGTPEILFYFLNRSPVPTEEGIEQFSRVHQFRRQLESYGVLYCNISNETEMRTLLHRHISSAVRDCLATKRDEAEDEDIDIEVVAPVQTESWDPLPNWSSLLKKASDVLVEVLLNDVTNEMDLFTNESNILTAEIEDFTKGLRSLADKVTSLNQNLAPAPNSLETITTALSSFRDMKSLMSTYISSLLRSIPLFHNSLGTALVKTQRVVNVLISERKLTASDAGTVRSSLLRLRVPISEIQPVVGALSNSVNEWPDLLPAISIKKRQMIALHDDLIDFCQTIIKLIDDILSQIGLSEA